MKTGRSATKISLSFIISGIFAIAMGALEAIVVVYIRQLYYPQGFEFPLSLFSQELISVEWLREGSTIVMLAAIGILAGKNYLQRFSYFLYTFAVWDIFYYVWLKILLDWPASLLTWDVLFLIPVPWIGPVLAPVISSLTMILLGGTIIFLQGKGYAVKLKLLEWGLIYVGSAIILYTFMWDYSRIIIHGWAFLNSASAAENAHFWKTISAYVPVYYNWYLFALGEVLILCAVGMMFRRIWGGVKENRSGIL